MPPPTEPDAPFTAPHPAMLDPWDAAFEWGAGTVMAILTATHGPAYRNAGAALAIAPDGRFAGAITSGCVEADLILRAAEVRGNGRVRNLRYGLGSPFFDMKLPCGGAVEIRLFPARDPETLAALVAARRARRPVSVRVTADGRLSLGDWEPTAMQGADFCLGLRPEPRFLIFGTGVEAATFAAVVRSMGYDHLLLSHEESGLSLPAAAGTPVRLIRSLPDPAELKADRDTAVVLFYHDHDHEPEVLRHMLATPAFYIGAQGSRQARMHRMARLAELGVSAAQSGRIHGPIGLVPSTRDAKSLAVSVLAEVLMVHSRQTAALAV